MTGLEIKAQIVLLGKTQKQMVESINRMTDVKTDTTELCRALKSDKYEKYTKVKKAAEKVLEVWRYDLTKI